MSKELKKFINEVSPWASIISLALALYWRFYPQSIWIFSVAETPFSIDSSLLVPLLFMVGIILLIKNKR